MVSYLSYFLYNFLRMCLGAVQVLLQRVVQSAHRLPTTVLHFQAHAHTVELYRLLGYHPVALFDITLRPPDINTGIQVSTICMNVRGSPL
jgi:hypothetical protein